MNAFKSFLDRCLDGLPRDKYRQRVQAELTDHLLSLAQDLEDAGESPEAAQNRAMALMGLPEELNKSFRAEWVRRASSWKFALRTAVTAAIQAYAFNLLLRWFLLMPMLLIGKNTLFSWLESENPIPFILFSTLNFLPGAWFMVHDWSRNLAIHPKGKALVFLCLLAACFLELAPFLGFIIALPTIFILPMVFVGHFTLILLSWGDAFYLPTYAAVILLISVFLALFYRPRQKSH